MNKTCVTNVRNLNQKNLSIQCENKHKCDESFEKQTELYIPIEKSKLSSSPGLVSQFYEFTAKKTNIIQYLY